MGRFERALFGKRLARKHLRFIMFIEKNESVGYHGHILLKAERYGYDVLHQALAMDERRTHESKADWKLICIDRTPWHIYRYVIKQLRPDWSGRIDTSPFVPSEVLFNIKSKECTPTQERM